MELKTLRARRWFAPWPAPRLPNWVKHVKTPLSDAELSAVRRSVVRGKPFGGERWPSRRSGC